MRLKAPTVAMLVLALFCFTCDKARAAEPEAELSTVRLAPELYEKSRYLDIVYVSGKFSYLSYLASFDDDRSDAKIACQPRPKTEGRAKGIWMWNMSRIAGKEKDTVARLAHDGFKKIYVQIGPDLDVITALLDEAQAAGIEVFALDGSPSNIDDYAPLLDDIARISAYNLKSDRPKIAGLQIDVEPYLKKDFNLRKEHYAAKYLQMLRDMKDKTVAPMKLSVAIPFWFDRLETEGKPLSNHAIDIADETVIMSYRTSFCGILEIAGNELTYAAQNAKPVYLGLETAKIDDERHYVISKEVADSLITETDGLQLNITDLEREGRCRTQYTVRGSDLSFSGQEGKLGEVLALEPAVASFVGYVIHSYESLY